MFLVILAGFLPCTFAALYLTPPEVAWVRLGQENVSLVCQANQKISMCGWTTPYGKKYVLGPNQKAEGGRLAPYGDNAQKECGILIGTVQANDTGKWTCNVQTTGPDFHVISADAKTSLNIASKPGPVSLEKPFDKPAINLTAGAATTVVCTVRNGKPPPTFAWTVNGTAVTGKTTNEEVQSNTEEITYKQTLHFTLSKEYANNTLRCSITHPSLDDEEYKEVVLSVSGSLFPDLSTSATTLPTGAIVGIVVAIAIAATITALCILLVGGKFSRKNGDRLDETEKISPDENEADMSAEKANSSNAAAVTTADETTGSQKFESFNIRFTTFFAKFRNDDKKMDETTASEFEKVDLNTEEGEEKKDEGEEKKDEEKEEAEAEAEGETVELKTTSGEKVRISKRVRSFINMFNKKARKEDVEMAVNEGEGKVDEKGEAEEKMEELEPEEKEAKKEQTEEKKPGSETPV